MTATNHALTGAIIAASITNPLIALPLALLSHYALDALPHFGAGRKFLESRAFKIMLVSDALICGLLVLVLALTNVQHWWIISLGAFLAASPDLALINLYRYARQGRARQWHPNVYNRFAGVIQWFEKPIGAAVEAVWFIGALTVLVSILRITG